MHPADAETRVDRRPQTRSFFGIAGAATLAIMIVACVFTMPYTLGWTIDPMDPQGAPRPRYDLQALDAILLPPSWAPYDDEERAAYDAFAGQLEQIKSNAAQTSPDVAARIDTDPYYLLGTDQLGRDFFTRCLAGGGISLCIGIAAATISVFIGTLYGMIAGYAGGRTDAIMMRIVDVLYGLPYILLVVLLAVAMDGFIGRMESRFEKARRAAAEAGETLNVPAWLEFAQSNVGLINVMTLLIAIGGVSWLTMARVIRGQVLSLKRQPFIEASRAIGAPVRWQFTRHLLPNLLGPITVYATLTVPQAILQESFLSFLGIGIEPPLPSWGNLASEGLSQLNPVKSRWWLLLWPCLLLGVTLLALNFIGEGLRESLDPKRRSDTATRE